MSVKASSWAWESSRSTGSSFLVLLALADHAGADGGDCWPSVARLARRCRVDERTVQRAIDKLVELGEVVITEGGGRGHSNRYKLTLRTVPQAGDDPGETPADCHSSPAERVTSTSVKGGTTPGEPRDEPKDTPLPPASGGPDASHQGQHPNCRSCGTNRRGPAPPDPEVEAAERRRRVLEESTAKVHADIERSKAEAVPPPPGLRDVLHPPTPPVEETGAA